MGAVGRNERFAFNRSRPRDGVHGGAGCIDEADGVRRSVLQVETAGPVQSDENRMTGPYDGVVLERHVGFVQVERTRGGLQFPTG